jgi:hypothetical protein
MSVPARRPLSHQTEQKRHYCACSNDRTISNRDAFQDNRTGAYPYVIPDSNPAADKRLLDYGGVHSDCMVVIRDVAEWADKTVASDLDAFRCIEHGEPVYVSASPKN